MGTNNEVSMVIYGEKGVSDPIVLGSRESDGYFKSGQEDEIKHDIGKDLGKLYKVRLGHSDETKNTWYCKYVSRI